MSFFIYGIALSQAAFMLLQGGPTLQSVGPTPAPTTYPGYPCSSSAYFYPATFYNSDNWPTTISIQSSNFDQNLVSGSWTFACNAGNHTTSTGGYDEFSASLQITYTNNDPDAGSSILGCSSYGVSGDDEVPTSLWSETHSTFTLLSPAVVGNGGSYNIPAYASQEVFVNYGDSATTNASASGDAAYSTTPGV